MAKTATAQERFIRSSTVWALAVKAYRKRAIVSVVEVSIDFGGDVPK
jgi:hypothetical protein